MTHPFPATIKRAAYLRANGYCQGCGKGLAAGDIHYDHIIPWTFCQDSSLGNCQVLCTTCHGGKTAGRDLPDIAKVKRIADFHHGIKGPGLGRKPMPCGRASPWKKTMSGRVVRREAGR